MPILFRVIAVTAICGIWLIPQLTNSMDIITAYEDDTIQSVKKSFNNDNFNEICPTSESYDRSHRFYFTLGERQDGNLTKTMYLLSDCLIKKIVCN